MGKLVLLFVLLSLPILSASLQGTVRNEQRVGLVGATIEAISEEGVAGTARAISGGNYEMELEDGVYLLNISYSSYPPAILLVSVEGPTNVDVIMTKNPPSCIYGAITYGLSFSGMDIYAVRDGEKASSAPVQQNGLYLLHGLDEGEYNVTITQGDYEPVRIAVSLKKSQCIKLDIELKKKEEKKEEKKEGEIIEIELIVPENVSVGEMIAVSILEDGEPAQNKTIAVKTPKGELTLVTDENGMASVYAADEGSYFFTFQNITGMTTAEGVGARGENVTEEAPPPPEPPEEKEPSWGLYALSILIGIIVFILLFLLFKEKKPKEEMKEEKITGPGEELEGPEKEAEKRPKTEERPKKGKRKGKRKKEKK